MKPEEFYNFTMQECEEINIASDYLKENLKKELSAYIAKSRILHSKAVQVKNSEVSHILRAGVSLAILLYRINLIPTRKTVN